MKSKSFIQYAMKNWDSNDAHDNVQKNRLQKILKKHFNLSCLFDSTIFISKHNFTWSVVQPNDTKEEILKNYYIHKPDILIKNPPIIIELDGFFHFNTKKGVNQTQLRNQNYSNMNVKFISFFTNQFNKITDVEIVNKIKLCLENN